MSLPITHDAHGPRPHPVQPLPGGLGLGLIRARVHEVCGPARASFAALILGQSQGTVIWISPGWMIERVFPAGLQGFADPGRILFARARRPEDLLWSMEEALRSGAAPLVLADLPHPPGLTPTRRLHLAAEAGAEAARHHGRLPPLGLLLTPGTGGAQGVESRWHMTPAPSGSTLYESRSAWHLSRLRARMAPPAHWHVQHDRAGTLTMTPLPTEV